MGFVPLRLILGVACLAVSLTGLCEAQDEEDSGLSVDFNETDIENELFPDLNSTTGELDLEQESSGEPVDECWDLNFGHPSVRNPDDTLYSLCPQESPETWREEDLGMSIECEAEYAILNYDLSKMASVKWLENIPVTISLYDKILIKNTRAVTDFGEASTKVEGFCPGTNYSICLEFNQGGDPSNKFCKVCQLCSISKSLPLVDFTLVCNLLKRRDPWRWDFVNGQMIVGPGARGALYGTLILPFTGRANCWRRIRNAYPTWDALQIHQLSKHVYVFCV